MLRYAVLLAVLSAALFGAATPASKWLLNELSPFQLAGLLYLGAALGVAPFAARGGGLKFPSTDSGSTRIRLLGAVVFGGVLGPALLLFGLQLADATSVSLWLNLELATTAALGAIFFKDHLGRLSWLGVALAVLAAMILSWDGTVAGFSAGALVLLATACWGLDNHLTAVIDGITPSQSTFWKGVVAGTVNILLGLLFNSFEASLVAIGSALLIGMLSYGASIVLYISSAQELGATRAQIIFSSAPFFGVTLSVLLLGESLLAKHIWAMGVFLLAIGLLIAESHGHRHAHDEIQHEHMHSHDDGHHDHDHPGQNVVGRHSHSHQHRVRSHSHPHWPDLHHRHQHSDE